MIIKNKDIKITIEVEGYSYPFVREYWDSNWLNLKIIIFSKRDNQTYVKNDSCLLTFELVNLKDWFLAIQNVKNKKTDIKFTEPSLRFEFENDILDILLKYNLNPKYEEDFELEYKLSFNLDNEKIKEIVDELDSYSKQFPEKVEFK